jgi:hypothetical protein
MMINDDLIHGNATRRFARAPYQGQVLFVDGEYVLKAKAQNISEGGILISELPHIPEVNSIPMMISLPVMPLLSTLSLDQLHTFDMESLPVNILKVRSRMMRTFSKESAQNVLVKNIGCEFYYPINGKEFNKTVSEYVETFSKNIVFLLGLFESLSKKEEHLETLRTTAAILGYNKDAKLPLLRAKVLHDYQSMEK